jgi:hypothetical protein
MKDTAENKASDSSHCAKAYIDKMWVGRVESKGCE